MYNKPPVFGLFKCSGKVLLQSLKMHQQIALLTQTVGKLITHLIYQASRTSE